METTRRELLKLAAAGGVVAAGLQLLHGAPATVPVGTTRRGDMLYRPLGTTGETVSIIGLGGFHIGTPDEDEAIRIMRTAIDRGVNFFDNSWDYHNGQSEVRMGKALRDGYRDRVFVMTKINGRTKRKAADELDECLQRFGLDHIELIQHHAVGPRDDPEKILGEDGAHAALVAAQKAGKVRFIGFTGHKDPAAHMRLLEAAKKHGVRFDTVQMPLNVMDAHFKSFEKTVLPVLVKDQIGVLCMKPLAGGHALESGAVRAKECLHYAMNLPTSVVITGIDSEKTLQQALDAAKTFEPMPQEQVTALLARTREAAKEGKYEPFKVSWSYLDEKQHRFDWVA